MHFTYKNTLFILLAALIVGGAFVVAEYRNNQSKKMVYTAPLVSTSTAAFTAELQSLDTDKDGLKDWEEVLLGTNPKNADTDGDKTPDGTEAAAGRNPLVKAPNDKNTDPIKNGVGASATLTPTDMVARDFFARYMELTQTGLTGDKASQLELIGEVVKSGMVLAKPKIYSQNDILVSSDDSKEAIRKYGNEVGALFIKYSNPNARNEVIIAKESVDQEEPEILKEIDPIIATYKNILTGVLKLSPPRTLTTIHLGLVNSLSILYFAADSLRNLEKDSLTGIQGSSVWLSGATGLNAAFNSLKAIFVGEGIRYLQGEPGNFFVP